MTPLILASSSPFRRALLERLHLPFETRAPDLDETPLDGETPWQLVERLALAKARAVAVQRSDALVIGSDQVAVVDGAMLGKPGGHENAVQQLHQLSGRQIIFLSGLALVKCGEKGAENRSEQSEVIPFVAHFRRLSSAQIENYLRLEPAYGCAGAFKSEGLGIALLEKMEGSDPNALIGLPLIALVRMLDNAGVHVI
ncbi:MAG: septum formation inhibitor Maf [Gammaproteobacteria bacterium]|nr:septum formation inhibitor Maf [Gammaproteobacteria bacterium]